ncbi:MAG: hypothetical protein AAGH74_17880, partial [Pseudomonadota bacterium]
LSETEATEALIQDLREALAVAAADAGAAEIEITHSVDRRTAEIEGIQTLIEATVAVTATGRPRHAHDETPEAPNSVSTF